MRQVRVLRVALVSVLTIGASAFAFSIAPSATAGATSVGASVPRLVQFAGAAVTAPATATTATFPTTTAAGDLLVVSASLYTGTTNRITSVTDSSGNLWTKIGAYASSSHYSDGEMWYSANSRPTTSVTVRTAKAALVAFGVQEFAGVLATNPLDGASGTSNLGKAPDSGSVTPSQSGDLVVGFLAGHPAHRQ